MPLTIDQPDSKYLEKTKISSSVRENPLSMAKSNGKGGLPSPASIGNKSRIDNVLKPDSHTSQSISSTPPPLEPIPPSSFPGESAKIYSGMPPLISSSSLPYSGSPEYLHHGAYERNSGALKTTANRNSQEKLMHKFPVPSTAPMSTSPLLMPPPLSSVKSIRPSIQDSSTRAYETGQTKIKYPDSSHDLYSSRPSSSGYHFHGNPNYSNQTRLSNGNGNLHHSKYERHPSSSNPKENILPSTSGGGRYVSNGEVPRATAMHESEFKSTEDSAEIINVDEDVDLERMYLDLITEEYTATVKRYV